MVIAPEPLRIPDPQRVPAALRVCSNDEVFPHRPITLVAGEPLTAHLSIPTLKAAVLRLDQLAGVYLTLDPKHRPVVDQLALKSVEALLPLHRALRTYADQQDPLLRSGRQVHVTTRNPIPPALVPLASMILATDAAIDIIDCNLVATEPRARAWNTQYRNLLRRALNRTADALLKQRAAAAAVDREHPSGQGA